MQKTNKSLGSVSKTGGRKRRDAAAEPTSLHIQNALELLSLNLFACWIFKIFCACSYPPLFPFGTLLSFIFSRLRSCLLLFFSLPFLPSTKRLYYVNDLFICKAISCSQKEIPPFTYYSHIHWTLTKYFYSLHLHFIIYWYICFQVQTRPDSILMCLFVSVF